MSKAPTCAKCQSAMEEGFVLDEGYSYRYVPRWVEGAPEKNVWIGVRLRKKRLLEVKTFRCATCGYLESYALPSNG